MDASFSYAFKTQDARIDCGIPGKGSSSSGAVGESPSKHKGDVTIADTTEMLLALLKSTGQKINISTGEVFCLHFVGYPLKQNTLRKRKKNSHKNLEVLDSNKRTQNRSQLLPQKGGVSQGPSERRAT